MRASSAPRRCLVVLAVLGAGGVFVAPGGAGPDLPPPPGPDLGFYRERIAPWVETHCAECHRAGGGALRLADAGQPEAERRLADFEALAPFVNRVAPWQSRLYLKVLHPAEGGDPHAGGAFVRRDEPAHDALLDFVSGATLTNLPPEVYLGEESIRARPGEEVVLDGRDSYDRDRGDMEHLRYWWTLAARPPDAAAALSDRRASRLVFTPDVGGSYVVTLRVGDGKVWSAARAVSIEVFDHHREVEARDPGGISGLAALEPRRLRRIRRLYLDVLGRGPTPAEAIAESRAEMRGLAESLLVRAEAGRAWYEDVTARLGLFADHRPQGEDALALPLRAPAEALAPAVMERTLVRDPSFLRRHPPGRSLAFAVARLLLDREPSAQEIEAAVALARGGTATLPGTGPLESPRAWLVAVTDSAAFAEAATLRRLRRFLPSGDARRRLADARRALAEGGAAWRAFLVELLSSDAYLDRRTLRAKDDLTFVRSLFFDLMERAPTDRELASMLHAVRQMPGSAAYAALAKAMIDSGEVPLPLLVEIEDGPRWLEDRFLRYLGRPPREAERTLYGQALVDVERGGGVGLVIYALLTGPEYACR